LVLGAAGFVTRTSPWAEVNRPPGPL